MNFDSLDQQLRDSFADMRLDNEERDELRELGAVLNPNHIRFMRNRAFIMAQEIIQNEAYDRSQAAQAVKWLRQVIKTLDQTIPAPIESSAHFTPGENCRDKIISLCVNSKQSIDVCVFTISDNHLSDELIKAHKRGIKVRIITDDEKQFDAGSDIQQLREAQIPLRTDDSASHMHHKFALFDSSILLNGSFNWTASATHSNAENLLTTDNPALVTQYLKQFEHLWQLYKGNK